MTKIAIVGGGPGGLFAAYQLGETCADLCQLTLFEASSRLGGKVSTRQFEQAPVRYEAGVAELYDYSHIGPDPVKQLVQKLGLSTVRMSGPTVVLGDAILRSSRDIQRHFGSGTLRALHDFQEQCRNLCPPAAYYEGHWQDDNQHPWAGKSFGQVLDGIPDEAARKYVAVATRSDLATEPHLTNALNGLKNVLMDDPRYLRLYSIVGGIERLTEGLAKHIPARVELDSPVVRVVRQADGKYRLTTRHHARFVEHEFDIVVLALPNYWLSRLEWGSRELRRTMDQHLAHYDRPAHYLRMTCLFEQPFWREQIPGSYFMQDAFGGCCVYDEGARHPCEPYGVLGWLLAGNDALALSNHDDRHLLDLALDALPESLAHGRSMFLEGHVHRWVGSINALPGGDPVLPTYQRHYPDPQQHPDLFLVGDYLFDSTINGVHDSADFVTDLILTRLRKQKYAPPLAVEVAAACEGSKCEGSNSYSSLSAHHASALTPGVVERDYHDRYDGERPYEQSWKEYFCEHYTVDLIRAIWGWSPPYKLLDCGSACGLTLEAFGKLGVEAWGVENSQYIHQRTPAKLRKRNVLGDVRKLDFPDNSFDFVYDTCLCHVPEEDLDQAIRELFRVCRVGVFYGGYTADMTVGVIEEYGVFEDAQSLFTLWQWSDLFLRNGFRVAASDPAVLARAWKIESAANEGDVSWYPDLESMRYCFYSKPNAPAPPAKTSRPRRTVRTARTRS